MTTGKRTHAESPSAECDRHPSSSSSSSSDHVDAARASTHVSSMASSLMGSVSSKSKLNPGAEVRVNHLSLPFLTVLVGVGYLFSFPCFLSFQLF